MENKKQDDIELDRELEKREELARAERLGEFRKSGYPNVEPDPKRPRMPSYRQRWGV
jgi:hypothetical protein